MDQAPTSLQDDTFSKLESIFLASGKGRRPSLPKLPVLTSRLLQQVLLLKEKGGKSFDDAAAFLYRLFPGESVKTLRYQLVRASGSENVSNEQLPLSQGPYLSGIGRDAILGNKEINSNEMKKPTYGLLKDLLVFKRKENGSTRDVCVWWERLTGVKMTETKMTQECKKCNTSVKKLQPATGRPEGKKKFDQFLDSTLTSDLFVSQQSLPVPGSSSEPDSMPKCASTQDNINIHSDIVLKLAAGARVLAGQRRREEELEKEVETLGERLKTAMNCSQEANRRNIELEREKEQLTVERNTLNADLAKSRRVVRELREELEEQDKEIRFYKKKGRQEEMNRMKEDLTAALEKAKVAEEKLRVLQLENADKRRQLGQMKEKIKELKLQQNVPGDLPEPGEELEERPTIRLKDEKGNFMPHARIGIMSLVGEKEVPANKCGEVIEEVIERICQAKVPKSDLPSQRSALRFADQGHVITKAHIAETLCTAERWDGHFDGTTRGGNKYVGQQYTTAEGTLSGDFQPVAREDTTTLVELAMSTLEELADLYPKQEAEQNFANMLLGMSGIMTDRAKVNKSFGRQMDEERRLLVNTEEGLDLLYCNAHFLLALAAECKKALSAEETGMELGRDREAQFRRFKSSECSAFRYVILFFMKFISNVVLTRICLKSNYKKYIINN